MLTTGKTVMQSEGTLGSFGILAHDDLETSILALVRTPGRTFPLQVICKLDVPDSITAGQYYQQHSERVERFLKAMELEGETFSIEQSRVGKAQALYTVRVTRKDTE